MTSAAPRGRRPGQPDTRAAIAAAARRRFLAASYPEVSLRSVAEEAGVDVALVGYYFGSKRGLFLAAFADVGEIRKRVGDAVLGGDLVTLPERLLTVILAVWDGPEGAAIRAVAGAAPAYPEIRALYTEAIERDFIGQLVERIAGSGVAAVDAERTAAVFALQISGIVYSRYLLRVEPVASMPPERLIDLFTPALTATLRGADRPRRPGGAPEAGDGGGRRRSPT